MIEACLWNRDGLIKEMHLTSNDSQSASIVGNLSPLAKEKWIGMKLAGSEKHGKVTVEKTTWQSLVKKQPLLLEEKFNFMVIDAQGAEYEIILGTGRELLQQFEKLLIECSTVSVYDDQKLQPEVEKLLESYGFRHSGVHYGDADHRDVLFLRNRTKKERILDVKAAAKLAQDNKEPQEKKAVT